MKAGLYLRNYLVSSLCCLMVASLVGYIVYAKEEGFPHEGIGSFVALIMFYMVLSGLLACITAAVLRCFDFSIRSIFASVLIYTVGIISFLVPLVLREQGGVHIIIPILATPLIAGVLSLVQRF